MKHIFALFLSFVLAVGIFTVPAFAAEPEDIPDAPLVGVTDPEEPEDPNDPPFPEDPERPEIQPQDTMPGGTEII